MRTAFDYISFYISNILVTALIGSSIYATCLKKGITCADSEPKNGGIARITAIVLRCAADLRAVEACGKWKGTLLTISLKCDLQSIKSVDRKKEKIN